jgi:hypothetical protein
MYFLINININNQSTLYKVNGIVDVRVQRMAGGMIYGSFQPPLTIEGDPQVEYFLENASNLVDSWFLNMIFGTLCVMDLKID